MPTSSLCTMEFVKDPFGKEMLIKDGKFQVMMEWEKPYMEACIDALAPKGDVLEIGFGCGYSASRIQEYAPSSHTIIEYHPKVIEKANLWAKGKNNVHIIHDTWQNALAHLGHFDVIFFDDYPLQSEPEMRTLKTHQHQTSSLLQKGDRLLAEVLELVPFLHTIQYTNDDLLGFIDHLTSQDIVDPKYLLKFARELEKRGQITSAQMNLFCGQLHKLGWLPEHVESILQNPDEPFAFAKRGDRLFEFLECCLKSHMRNGARFSCFLEESTSKYEDRDFYEKIITNPFLEYREDWISVEVPQHCTYFRSPQALVMTITRKL